MIYIKDTLDFKIEEPSVISLGKFDGLHLGHKYLMEELTKGAKEGLKTVIFTFNIPPKSAYGEDCKLLSTNDEKTKIFEEAGVDYLIECPFTDEFRMLSPFEFLKMLCDKINVKKFVAGTDFGFGYKRSGTYVELQKYGPELGYEAVIVEKMQMDGSDISSTRIRNAVIAGDLVEADKLLGYTYFLDAEVVHGNALGRQIGIPTANQLPDDDKLLPPRGVYAAYVDIDGVRYKGVCNIGIKPTISGVRKVGVETHILDYSGEEIYGKIIRTYFVKFIRSEMKFESIDALVAQMEKDVVTARNIFTNL